MFGCCFRPSEEDIALQEEYDKLKHRPTIAHAKSPQPLVVMSNQQQEGDDFSPEANERRIEKQKVRLSDYLLCRA